MPLLNTQTSWGSVAKALHWLIALLVIFMLLLGLTMGNFPKPFKYTLYAIHKSTGLTILLLMLIRLAWRLINVTPTLPQHLPHWQQIAARISHALLYITLIAMPLSGWVMSTAAGKPTTFWWLFTINAPFVPASKALAGSARQLHGILAWTIVTLLTIHIIAALKHHFYHKDTILKRMLPCCKKSSL